MQVHTPSFGELEIPDDAVLTFSQGIFGFPELRECCLLPYDPGSGLRWLQCLNDANLTFLTVEPHVLFPDYDVNLADSDAGLLGLSRAEDAAILTLVTISAGGRAVTTNLAAPIIINIRTREARQIILDDERYLTRHMIGAKRVCDARADESTRPAATAAPQRESDDAELRP